MPDAARLRLSWHALLDRLERADPHGVQRCKGVRLVLAYALGAWFGERLAATAGHAGAGRAA